MRYLFSSCIQRGTVILKRQKVSYGVIHYSGDLSSSPASTDDRLYLQEDHQLCTLISSMYSRVIVILLLGILHCTLVCGGGTLSEITETTISPRSALLTMPIPLHPYESLGDQVLLIGGLLGIARTNRFDEIHVCHDRSKPEVIALYDTAFNYVHKAIKNIVAIKNCIKKNKWHQYSERFNIGADCLDGYYSCSASFYSWLHFFRQPQLSSIISSSFELFKASQCTQPSQLTSSISKFNFLNDKGTCQKSVFARDYQSFLDLTSLVNDSSHKCIHCAADVAFLLPVATMLPTDFHLIQEAIAAVRSKDKLIAVINLNIHPASGINVDIFLEQVVKSICRLNQEKVSEKEIAYLYVPHEYRSSQNDSVILLKFVDRLKSTCHGVESLNLQPLDRLNAIEARALISQADITFTSRMHVAIQSIGQGIPTAILPVHQSKFTFIDSIFNIKNATLRNYIQADGFASIYQFMKSRILLISTDKEMIATRLEHVLKLANSNFARYE
jgi:hypothetical protein